MASESQDIEEDDLLAAFENDDNYDYEYELGTQVPVDMGEFGDNAEIAMIVDHESHDVHQESVLQESAENTSTANLNRLRDNEGVVDVEDYSPKLADFQALTKMYVFSEVFQSLLECWLSD